MSGVSATTILAGATLAATAAATAYTISQPHGSSGGGAPGQLAAAPPPVAPVLPTPVATPPARNDADIQSRAAEQRRRYSTMGSTPTNLTGGLGVPSGSTYSASASLLGA